MYSKLTAAAVVADIGCGPGPFEYQRYSPRFIAFDAFPVEDTTGLKPQDEFRLGRLDAFPIANASCDAVVMGFILEHMRDPVPFLRETERVLRPGGWCYIAVPNYRSLEDRLFRMATRVAGSTRGPHVKRFTFGNVVAMVRENTSLELQAWHPLQGSFLWMLHPRLRALRPAWIRLLTTLRCAGIDLLKESNYQFLFRKPAWWDTTE